MGSNVTIIADESFPGVLSSGAKVLSSLVLSEGIKYIWFLPSVSGSIHIPASVIDMGNVRDDYHGNIEYHYPSFNCSSDYPLSQSFRFLDETYEGERPIYNPLAENMGDIEKITVSKKNPKYYSSGNCIMVDDVLVAGCKNSIIPNNTLIIGGGAFDGCKNLSSINIPNSVEYICPRALFGCTSLTSMTIPNNVICLGNDAFDSCTKLKTIILSSSLKSIEGNAFCNTALESIIIPESVEYIESALFEDCPNLEFVQFPHTLEIFKTGGMFANCTKLKTVVLPDNLTKLSGGMFDGCTSLQTIKYKGVAYTSRSTLTEALTANNVSLSSTAFANCGFPE